MDIEEERMLHMERSQARGQYSVRGLPILESEEVEERFVPDDGLVSNTPGKGRLLVLTNQRLMAFVQNDGNKETIIAPLDELNGVSIKASTKGLKNLSQGLIIVVTSIVAYIIIGYILESITIAAILGSVILLVGVLFIARHFFWEDEGSITFRGSGLELAFPYRTTMAGSDAYKLVSRFFQLKLNPRTHHATPRDVRKVLQLDMDRQTQ